MAQASLIGWALLAGLIGFAIGVCALARRWSRGQPAPLHWAGVLDAPRRYLVNVHHKVVRRRGVGGYHIAAALGFIILTGLVLTILVSDWRSEVLRLAGVSAAATSLAGVALLAGRRWRHWGFARHKAIQLGGLALIVVALGVLVLVATPAFAAVDAPIWVAAIATLLLFPLLPIGPLRHALAGYINLSVHARPERFASPVPRSAPKPLDLDAARLGVETRRDFGWNQLVQFDACVECRRCEEVCPANAAGTALNPMFLVNALRRADDDAALLEAAVDPDAIWACTTCNACVEVCPMFIEHVDAIVDLRRFATLEQGRTPGAAAMLENLASFDQAEARPLETRLDWAADLALRRLAPGEYAPLLLWVGDAGFLPEGRRTLRALIALLARAGTTVAVLPDEADLGDIALRLGDEARFRALAQANAARLDAVSFDHIVTIDPHVVQALAGDYRAIGRHWPVVHHSQLLDALVAEGRLKSATGASSDVTYHDPCYLGRHGGEYDAPRRLVVATGAPLREMARSRETSFCCGYGGGATITDVPGKVRIPDLRIAQARATGATTIATACPNCAVMLAGSAGTDMQVRDIAELLLLAQDAAQ